MKKLLFSVLLLPVLALAQEPVIVDKKVVCNWTETILETLSKDFKETPIWLGNAGESQYSLFTSTSGDWTLIQFNREIACVIGAGSKSQQIFKGPKI